jgi:hypothetical protein
MDCTGCRREKTIGLMGGDSVCSYCPEWAKECLRREDSARVLLRVGTVTQRQAWLADYELRNGPVAAERLKAVFKKMWSEK